MDSIKQRTEDVLIELGMPVNIKGFTYITSAMEIFENTGKDIRITTLYGVIAEMHDTTSSRVERAIRHALQQAYEKAPLDIATKYLDMRNQTNGASLHMLHLKIKKEMEVLKIENND